MKPIWIFLCLLLAAEAGFSETSFAGERARARELGISSGILTPGKWNAITDVNGVKVGHKTLIEGDSVRTGVTVIIPHGDNIFQNKVPAAVYVGNGFGKAIGFTQIEELGNIETPIALTNTLNSFLVANALVDYSLKQTGNGDIGSVNPVVGETNDGRLNDIRTRSINAAHVYDAIDAARSGSVAEGNVGAGTGTVALGFKGGIGTSSRVLPKDKGAYTVGVRVIFLELVRIRTKTLFVTHFNFDHFFFTQSTKFFGPGTWRQSTIILLQKPK